MLHTVKYGESSLVAYLFTDVGGRQTYMIQGVRSSRGRGNKAALFQPMFLLEFEGVEQPHAEMHRMKEVRNLVPLSSVPFDVRKSTVSLFMAEVLYRLIREVEANEPLFDFICSAVQQLDRMETGVATSFCSCAPVGLSGVLSRNEYRDGGWSDIRSGLFCDAMPQHCTCMGPASARLLGGLMERSRRLEFSGGSDGERLEFMEAMLIFFGYHFDAIHSVQSLRILREVFWLMTEVG